MERHHGLGAIPDTEENHVGEVEEAEPEMELGQAGANLVVGAEERPNNRNACCICHEPWASCGAHRICCIPCGHVYGRSCLEAWLIRSGCREAKCLWCEEQFKREDIVNLYGTTEHLWDGHHHEQAASQVVAAEEEATWQWQVTRAAMEALVARETAEIIVRQQIEIARENLAIARRNEERARQNVETACGNMEIARRNLVWARVNEATSIVLVILFVIVALLYYNL